MYNLAYEIVGYFMGSMFNLSKVDFQITGGGFKWRIYQGFQFPFLFCPLLRLEDACYNVLECELGLEA